MLITFRQKHLLYTQKLFFPNRAQGEPDKPEFLNIDLENITPVSAGCEAAPLEIFVGINYYYYILKSSR